jgi:stage V sporulation protein D (sporulation-specific penicillin-binding protein)
MRLRLLTLLIFFLLLYLALAFNVYNLQIEKSAYYTFRSEAQNRLAGFLAAKRGNIYFTDKNNNLIPAAINKKFPVIFSIPKEISDPAGTARQLASILNLSEEKLISSFSKSNDPYEPVLKKADKGQVEKIRQLDLPGIYIDEEDFRFYPFNDLAAQVLGFLAPTAENPEISGKYGVEEFFNQTLSGKTGKLEGDKITPPVNGENIILTLDPNIQTRAEDILDNLVKKFKAEGGSVIVQDPKTGKILALGNNPSFNPNNYFEYQLSNFSNPAVQAIYEPGSVFKIITMAAGIETGKITPETAFVDTGSVTLDGRTIKNWDLQKHGPHGRVTMTEVIEQSINTGAVFAQRQMGRDIFYKYVKDFGFEELTGIELPGEVSGDLRNLKSSFRDINFATASFGQGVAVTPLEIIRAFSAIANGGVMLQPTILANQEPKIFRQVISEETAKKITDMMVSAVRKAQIAQIPKYDIAGKTGTAQIPDLVRGGYQEAFIHTYVGFAPAYNPRFIILLKLDKPQAELAGLTVVPAFRELAEFILNYYNVPPDHLE